MVGVLQSSESVEDSEDILPVEGIPERDKTINSCLYQHNYMD